MRAAETPEVSLSPSLICADLRDLHREVERLEEAGANRFHFDVMDGRFVPNFGLGPDLLRAVRSLTSLPIDVHMMVCDPEAHVQTMIEAGADLISLHVESSPDLHRSFARIRRAGRRAGLAINPGTPLHSLRYYAPYIDRLLLMTVDPGFSGQPFIPEVLDKIVEACRFREQTGTRFTIEVDGAINETTIPTVVQFGADILVLGTSGLFGHPQGLRGAMELARRLASEALAKREPLRGGP